MNQPTVTLETITPQMAAAYLKGNSANRHIIYNHLDRLASQMLAGEWRLTGDTIKFNGDRLLDGQHRLEAIVRSGVAIQCFVARNVETESFPMIDTGRSRQGGDVLSAHGYTNVFMTSASCRVIWFIERKIASLDGFVSNNTILNTIKRHKDLPRFVSDISSYRFAKIAAIVSSLWWLWLCDKAAGDQFIESFLSGSDLKATSPIHLLRERLINDPVLRTTKRGRRALVAMMFRTWGNWRSNKPVSTVKASQPGDMDFPWPEGGPYLV